jgi:hypothetical protein
MRARAIAIALLVCAPMTQGCHPRAGAAEEESPLEIRLALQDENGASQHTFDASKTLTFELAVKNTSEAAATLSLPSAKTHDFIVLSSEGIELWRASKGRFYGQMLTEITIAPGETRRFTSSWNQVCSDGSEAPTGEYRAMGFLATNPPRPGGTPSPFTIR